MQQTEKYKLNLIESSDPFLPEGLNQNTQKVEDTLNAFQNVLYAMEDVQNGFDQRLGTGGKNARVAWGTYEGNNNNNNASRPRVLTFEFYPVAVIIADAYTVNDSGGINIRGMPSDRYGPNSAVKGHLDFRENGVSFYGLNGPYMDGDGQTHFYVAIGYDKNAEQ